MSRHVFQFGLMAALFVYGLCECGSDAVAGDVDYQSQIKPILTEKCYSCHGVLKQEGGLRLETRSLILNGGDSGPALIVGDPASSHIIERVTAGSEIRMPPAADGAALKPEQIELLKRWIAEGAVAPQEELPTGPREHWAFQRIERPANAESIQTADQTAVTNPIDRLLNSQLRQHGIVAMPQAARAIRIRRLYLDLIGLPPSLEQLHDDRSWEAIVDELLASPQHGERWGRHWMDVWRYSDWYGLGAQLRNSQKHMWHWRDWIVNSLNADKGYDRMIHEMLAGDELAPEDPDVVAGTGFLARNYYLFNRTTWLDSTIEHTGKAFLGLTLNCAKCHDHKYDPISHVDYYSFRAIFEPHQVRLDPVPGVTDFEADGLPRVFDDQLDAETYLHLRGDPLNPDKENKISARVPLLFASFQPSITPIDLPPEAFALTLRNHVQETHLAAAAAQVDEAKQELAKAVERLSQTQSHPSKVSGNDSDEALPQAGELQFMDEFSAANPDVWEIVGKDWQYKDGALLRTSSTRDAEFVRFRKSLPADFELTCQYTTTGGATYKSVTFRFDESEDQKFSNYVYTSAYDAGPKVQVAWSRDGNSVYPADGSVAKPITVGESYELRFAVRDRLINVWLNDEFIMAYELPDRKVEGHLSLQAFDATVAYNWIRIRSLPVDMQLRKATRASSAPQDPATQVVLAEAKLLAAETSLESLKAILAADQAKYGKASSERIRETAALAAVRQAASLVAQADYDVLAANGDAAKTKAATERAANARQRLKAAESGQGHYNGLSVAKKALEGPDDSEAKHSMVYPATSTGRRLALAQWMTHRDNPLTARVAVNQVWMRHFGEPLVESVFDFGLRAKRPLHADVLDYLAVELMESGWSFRHLHRLIVTSAAYQRSSSIAGCDPTALTTDPGNTLYWRMNTRRMESELIRDSMLQLAGILDLKTGGPSVDVGNGSHRRSLYYKHSRDDQDKFLTMFDNADLLQCYRRSESIVPQQALALANSELAMLMADGIALRISQTLATSDRTEFTDAVFEALLGRRPSVDERHECLAFCQELGELLRQAEGIKDQDIEHRVRTRLVHSLLNHNDFVSVR